MCNRCYNPNKLLESYAPLKDKKTKKKKKCQKKPKTKTKGHIGDTNVWQFSEIQEPQRLYRYTR